MSSENDNYLDNPVWYSLTQHHRDFAVDYGHVKFYHPDYCPFGGFEKGPDIAKYLDEYSALTDNFFVVGEKPEHSSQLTLKKELICLQMIVEDRIKAALDHAIIKLLPSHEDALFQLVNLVQPGYFRKRTSLLGNYYGIFKGEELIAVAGERMQMNDFVEVSAIVTHPKHTGKGYASQLIAHTVNTIFNQNKTPYLHVVETNPAVKLYEKLGFSTRRKISFWNFAR
jgi:ribosomal protein S18 acetylase RimI-like enzyme